MDGAIESVMQHRDQDSAPKGLTRQDLFYREVKKCKYFFVIEKFSFLPKSAPSNPNYNFVIL